MSGSVSKFCRRCGTQFEGLAFHAFCKELLALRDALRE